MLTELGKMQSKEARLILGAAIVDDILAIAALSVVITMGTDRKCSPRYYKHNPYFKNTLDFFGALLIGVFL